jgi:hypothetical protein
MDTFETYHSTTHMQRKLHVYVFAKYVLLELILGFFSKSGINLGFNHPREKGGVGPMYTPQLEV